jgi:hypothetical protein
MGSNPANCTKHFTKTISNFVIVTELVYLQSRNGFQKSENHTDNNQWIGGKSATPPLRIHCQARSRLEFLMLLVYLKKECSDNLKKKATCLIHRKSLNVTNKTQIRWRGVSSLYLARGQTLCGNGKAVIPQELNFVFPSKILHNILESPRKNTSFFPIGTRLTFSFHMKRCKIYWSTKYHESLF